MSAIWCPASNGEAMFSGRNVYDMHCGIALSGKGFPVYQTNSFEDCVAKCTSTVCGSLACQKYACVGVTWDENTGSCYRSNTLTGAKSDAAAWSALLSSAQDPTCTYSLYHNAVWTTINDERYKISCPRKSAQDENAPKDDFPTNEPEARSVSLSARDVTFKDCIVSCDLADNCQAIAFDRGTCLLLRGGKGDPTTTNDMWFAHKAGKVYPPRTTTTTTIISTTASTTTASPTTLITTTKSSTTTTTTTTTSPVVTTTTTSTTTSAMSTTTTTTTTARPTATSGPCANSAPFIREFTDAKGISWGVCQDTVIEGENIVGEVAVPSNIPANERPEYCARSCGSVRGCVSSMVHTGPWNANCQMRAQAVSASSRADMATLFRKDPPISPGTGPCHRGYESVRIYTASNGAIYALCPNNAISAYGYEGANFDAGVTDYFATSVEKCIQKRELGCLFTMFAPSDYRFGYPVWSSRNINMDADMAVLVSPAP